MASFCLWLWFLVPPSVQASRSTFSAVGLSCSLVPLLLHIGAAGICLPTLVSELSPSWLEGFSALHSVLIAQRQYVPGSTPAWSTHPSPGRF